MTEKSADTMVIAKTVNTINAVIVRNLVAIGVSTRDCGEEKSVDERTCETCKYNNRTWDMEPCDSCTIGGDGNKWEPKVKGESSYIVIEKYKVIYGRGEEHDSGAKMEGGTSMTATERSEKLPIGYEVRLMKICERCTYPKLQIEVGRTFSEELLNIKGRKGIIRCENEIQCRAVIEMYEGAKYDGEGIPEQDTSI